MISKFLNAVYDDWPGVFLFVCYGLSASLVAAFLLWVIGASDEMAVGSFLGYIGGCAICCTFIQIKERL